MSVNRIGKTPTLEKMLTGESGLHYNASLAFV
jgi:hypothetical protein